MSNAVILQHAPYAGPGRLVPVFRDFGIPCETRHLYRGDEVPDDLDAIRVLVVLGGPMGVADVGSETFPYLAKEVALIKRLIAADRPMLGIALGAQLLARAGGANVYPNTTGGAAPDAAKAAAPELGWGGVSFPFPGGTEPMVYGMIDGAPMFHWHFDAFDLPKLSAPANLPPGAPPPPSGSSLLSSSKLCKNQAFRFKTKLFGFQYHFEFTPAEIEGVVANADEKAKAALGSDGLSRIAAETTQHYTRHARLGNKLMENFVQFLRAY